MAQITVIPLLYCFLLRRPVMHTGILLLWVYADLHRCQCTVSLILSQTSLPRLPSDCVAFTQRCHRIAPFRRLAAETLFSGVLTDINDTIHQSVFEKCFL